MADVQIKSVVGILALVAACGGAIALFVKQGHGRDGQRSGSASASTGNPAAQPEAVAGSAVQTEAPVKLSSLGIAEVREYFTASGYRFEDKPLPGDVARVIGTSQNGRSALEFVGLAALERATLRYALEPGALNGQDMAAIMYLMQQVKAGEANVRWGIEAARKGEPTTRTIGAVAYAIQRGPTGTNELVMRPAPGFE